MTNEFVVVPYRNLSIKLLRDSQYFKKITNVDTNIMKEQILEEAFRNGAIYGVAVSRK